MDIPTLTKIKELLDEIFEKGRPSEEDLDFDIDAVAIYDNAYSLKEAMERFGI